MLLIPPPTRFAASQGGPDPSAVLPTADRAIVRCPSALGNCRPPRKASWLLWTRGVWSGTLPSSGVGSFRGGQLACSFRPVLIEETHGDEGRIQEPEEPVSLCPCVSC